MATKSIRIDPEVIEILRQKAPNKHPNTVLREMLGLPERKHSRSKLTQDHLSRAKRSLLRALQEIEEAEAK